MSARPHSGDYSDKASEGVENIKLKKPEFHSGILRILRVSLMRPRPESKRAIITRSADNISPARLLPVVLVG